MKLRDLTNKQLKKLQKQCDKEFEVEADKTDVLDLCSLWRRAWSNGLKAGLELHE